MSKGKEHFSSAELLDIPHLNLAQINLSYFEVQRQWQQIDDELDRLKIGRKDTPFNFLVMTRMVSAYDYLNGLLMKGIEPFSPESFGHMLELNARVHFGVDRDLRKEEGKFIDATFEKFHGRISPIKDWYHRHKKRGDDPRKIAAEIYVAVIGMPQLFIEGNHRTGSLISSWINMYYGYPPFVLSVDNAIPYFAPSSEIKKFTAKSNWRSKWKLPKYRKEFLSFWQEATDKKYMLK